MPQLLEANTRHMHQVSRMVFGSGNPLDYKLF